MSCVTYENDNIDVNTLIEYCYDSDFIIKIVIKLNPRGLSQSLSQSLLFAYFFTFLSILLLYFKADVAICVAKI